MTASHTLMFADSEVAAVTAVATGIHIRLSAAHVLFLERPDAGNSTEGFSRGVEILLPGAQWPDGALSGFMGRISEGRIRVGTAWAVKLPFPCSVSAPIQIELSFANQSHLELSAAGLECRFEGEANFSESLFC
ncbi:hypothetical protein [Azohydromonas aeria]|uniref:hypothetical protein n=1 Tax=Azohydromonas aeria TaxID=2590212 RepID=UPI0012F8A69F|nr:hypothetical protein [Azohydromonas aeria]